MEWGAKRRRTGGNDGTAGGASSTDASTEGQEAAISWRHDYEVFLSFRGPDTRQGFTDFLYHSLKRVGIRTFRDDDELSMGGEIGPGLSEAIEQSKILIPIFSKGYASSKWCLDELVQMVECQENERQKIMPIFYDVAPSEVRCQTGKYLEVFRSHEKQYDRDTICKWKDALSAVAVKKGWNLLSKTTRREGEFVEEVTEEVFRELKQAYLVVSDHLVSVDNDVDAIMEMIGAPTSETQIIGIHGMGGIGKTTIAKIIYDKLSSNFKDCCFLADIRETSESKGITCLQNQLISDILKVKQMDINSREKGIDTIKKRLSHKRVLLLLDDVEKEDHIKALVGKRDWYGRRSKIIITTRKKDILYALKVDHTYELSVMDDDRALQLFNKHAFIGDSPLDEDKDRSIKAIRIAGGLPLALEVMGSLLCRTEREKWDDQLNKWENVPPDDVMSTLKISYDALHDREKHIFLDIACLFIGYDKDIVVHFWDTPRVCPKVAIGVLQNMSLIKITEDNKVWMHDQLRDLGREIVFNNTKKEQSRVWDPKEGLDLLRKHKGEKKVEALRLNLDNQDNHQRYCFSYKGFENISNLRFLEVDCSMENFRAEDRLLWHDSLSNLLPIDDFQENSHLLPQLRWLSWPQIPPTFKITNFSMEDVVFLDLSRSNITHDWKGWSHMKVMKNLKVMDLSHCDYLERTPDFSAHPKLERLILKVCWGLVEIDESIGQLKSLVFLDVNYCRELQKLPNTIGDLASLKELDILHSGIRKLPDSIKKLILLTKLNISGMKIEKLPYSIRKLESLIELDVSYSKIKELPDSIGELQNLKVVKMNGCSTSNIPDALWEIKKLEVIEATARHVNVKIGNGIYGNQALRILKLKGARMYEVPRLPEGLTILRLSNLYMNTFPDLSSLTNLEKLELHLAGRDSDGESDGPVEEDPMPRRIGNLSKLEYLFLESPYVTALPDISLLPHLRVLTLQCADLRCLPSLPSSLSNLTLKSERLTTLSTDMSSLLPQLKTLLLRCPNLPCLPSLPSGLSSLWLESKCVTTLPTDISTLLPQLGFLKLLCCPNLGDLPSLPSSLSCLWLENGKSCRSMGDLSNLKTLAYLEIIECAISEIQGLDRLENLKTLELRKLQWVKILPDLRNLNKLWRLRVSDCGNLVEIQGEFPSSLEDLEILDCGSLRKLPDLSSLKELPRICLKRCEKLDVEAIYSLYPKEEGESEGDDIEFDDESEGDDIEFDDECEDDDIEFDDESEGDDIEFDNESEGGDDESRCKSEYESEGEY